MEQLFGAIPGVLGKLGANESIDEAVAFAAWQLCAGELLRERTAALEFFERRLVVAVEDDTWQRHLEDLSPQMLAKINGTLGQGTVKYIEFRINKKAVNARRKNKKDALTNETAVDIAPSLTTAAEAIADEGLRDQFLRAAAAYLARQ